MGFFSASKPRTFRCNVCLREVNADMYQKEVGMCSGCTVIAESFLTSEMFPGIKRFQAEANKATDPDMRIGFLRHMLDVLYKYKVTYQDNDVRLIDHDVDDQIDHVLQVISRAREP